MMAGQIENKEGILRRLGISLFNENGECKSTYAILTELAEVWKTFSPIQEEFYSEIFFNKVGEYE